MTRRRALPPSRSSQRGSAARASSRSATAGIAPLPIDWLKRFGPHIADLLAARQVGERDRVTPAALPDLARLCDDLDVPRPAALGRLADIGRRVGRPGGRRPTPGFAGGRTRGSPPPLSTRRRRLALFVARGRARRAAGRRHGSRQDAPGVVRARRTLSRRRADERAARLGTRGRALPARAARLDLSRARDANSTRRPI